MMPDPFIHERLTQAHQLDLLREAEHERRLAQLPQPKHHITPISHLLPSLRFLFKRFQKRLQRRTT